MQLQTRTSPIRDLAHGTIVDLPGIGPAVYYFDHPDTTHDETVWKPKFSIPSRMVLREYDEVVPIIATPLEAAMVYVARVTHRHPRLAAENSPPKPRRFTRFQKEQYWFFPPDIEIGSIVLTPAHGMGVYRGILPTGSGDQEATCYTYTGSIITLPIKKRVFTKLAPVHVAWEFLKNTPNFAFTSAE